MSQEHVHADIYTKSKKTKVSDLRRSGFGTPRQATGHSETDDKQFKFRSNSFNQVF